MQRDVFAIGTLTFIAHYGSAMAGAANVHQRYLSPTAGIELSCATKRLCRDGTPLLRRVGGRSPSYPDKPSNLDHMTVRLVAHTFGSVIGNRADDNGAGRKAADSWARAIAARHP